MAKQQRPQMQGYSPKAQPQVSAPKNANTSEPKKKGGLFRRIKEAFSELKKVTWPGFKTAVKKTSAVIAITLFFGVALIAFDALFSWLYQLLMSGI